MTGGEAALIWSPFPDEAAARASVAALLDERLIACGNLVPGIHSLFVWRSAPGESDECGALLKTTAALRERAMRRLAELHPYETPAITGWTVHADAGTAAWLSSETSAQ